MRVALTVLAVVLALLAVSDMLKPLRLEGADTGLVFLGRRLTGPAGVTAGVASSGIWSAAHCTADSEPGFFATSWLTKSALVIVMFGPPTLLAY